MKKPQIIDEDLEFALNILSGIGAGVLILLVLL